MMKATNLLAQAITLLGICCIGSAQTSTATANTSATRAPDYSITLSQPSDPFYLNSPIEVTMTIKNITNGDILWRAERSTEKDGWYHGFKFLLQQNGREVETTIFHRKISGRQRPSDPQDVWNGSTILLSKQPGTIFVMTIDLKHLYQITEPGNYTLQVSRTEEDNGTTVHSNIVTLQVLP